MTNSKLKYFLRQLLRILEKIPGINLVQSVEIYGLRILMTPKVASRTIRNHLLRYHNQPLDRLDHAWYYIEYHTRKEYARNVNKSDIIVLRHPLERLHSCWKQKVDNFSNGKLFYFWYYWPLIKPKQSFEEFLYAISLIPPALCEKHFIPITWNIEDACKKATVIAIDDLDKFLEKNRIGEDLKRANVTSKTKITEEARRFFDNHLAERHSYELDLLSNIRR